MPKANDLRTQVLDLPRDERASLAQDLLASLDEPHDDPASVQAAWLAEVQRRMAEIDDGTVQLVDWETVRDEALARVRRA